MRLARVAAIVTGAVVLSAHVGSPNVFFSGKAGPYDVRVVVRPPEVVPGVARVTVRTLEDVERVAIRPVYWRAGSRGAPSADETRRLEGDARTFEGSLWLMQRGAYTVDVIVEGSRGAASVLVPVASVATGRLEMRAGLMALLVLLGVLLCAGLVTIVHRSAGEALVPEGAGLEPARRARARRIAAVSVPVIGLMLFGGAKWWSAVDRDYERTLYRPSPLRLQRAGATLHVQPGDTVWEPGRRVSRLVPDHGKLMHLFLVRRQDARAFAHLHPAGPDTSAVPHLVTRMPALPPGDYHVFGDVVHETGFERTLTGAITIPDSVRGSDVAADPDDAWFVGDAATDGVMRLADGTVMRVELTPPGAIEAQRELSIRVRVTDAGGRPARLEPYLGMAAHAVVLRVDGSVYVHLHPMGTASTAAQQVFAARDRGDTTAAGRVRLMDHSAHAAPAATAAMDSLAGAVEFPYAFPRGGDYRLFVQVKRGGRILTGAFAIAAVERVAAR